MSRAIHALATSLVLSCIPAAALAQAGCTPEHAAMGHCTPAAATAAPREAIPVPTDADRAAAFAPLGSTVTLEARDQTIAVTDQGPGVPDFAMPQLGNKFFSTVRPDGVTKGSGLGLAIVQQIMALHGGRMVVRNGEPGLLVELHFE